MNVVSPPVTTAEEPSRLVKVTWKRVGSTAPGEYSSTMYGWDLKAAMAQ